METKIVKAVRRTGRVPEKVYNLKVAKNRNYFVNGILVHNCDDPHDPEQAGSDTQRQIAIDVWDQKYASRGVVKRVKRAIVAQRLGPDDLSGHVLETDNAVAHLRMPMEFEAEFRCSTNIEYLRHDWSSGVLQFVPTRGWTDPRTTEKELLFPALWDQEKVDQYKRRLRRAHAIAGQMQQRPTSPAGDMFVNGWFGQFASEYPKNVPACRAWDLASATGSRADYTAGVLGCYDGEYLYIIDVVDEKLERVDRNKLIWEKTESDLRVFADYHIRFEREGGSGGMDAVQIICEELSKIARPVIDAAKGKPKFDDPTMKGWERWADFLAKGWVKFVCTADTPWYKRLVSQHLAAPLGRHDDIIDAASRTCRGLSEGLRRGSLNRDTLHMEPAEYQKLLQEHADRERDRPTKPRSTCDNCGGLGCNACEFSGYSGGRQAALGSIFDAACAGRDEGTFGF